MRLPDVDQATGGDGGSAPMEACGFGKPAALSA